MKKVSLVVSVIFTIVFSNLLYSSKIKNTPKDSGNNFIQKKEKNKKKSRNIYRKKKSFSKYNFYKKQSLKHRAKFLVFDNKTIYRFKSGESLSKAEINLYLKFIRMGGYKKTLKSKGHVHRVANGSSLMRLITYDHLERILVTIHENLSKKSDNNDKNKEYLLFSNPYIIELLNGQENLRGKLIDSSLGGLLNPDPRVRLVSIYLLRRLIPDVEDWDFVNELIKEQKHGIIKDSKVGIDASSIETVKKLPYLYIEFNSKVTSRTVYDELKKLLRFMSRFILINQVRDGSLKDINTYPKLYTLLSKTIDNEGYCKIPINYFKSQMEAEFILTGINSKNELIRETSADNVVRIIRTVDSDPDLKKYLFNSLLISNYRYKVAEGLTDEDVNLLKENEIDEMLKNFLDENGLIQGCQAESLDRYDAKGHSSKGKSKPVKTEKTKKIKKTDENLYKRVVEQDKQNKNLIVEEYISE